MENLKLTCEEYDNLKKEKKKIRDNLFDLKLKIFMNKDNEEKHKLLLDKEKILKKELIKINRLISTYEIEKIKEEKKEGKKK